MIFVEETADVDVSLMSVRSGNLVVVVILNSATLEGSNEVDPETVVLRRPPGVVSGKGYIVFNLTIHA